MIEDENKNTITNDDMSVLRELLQRVKGISTVSEGAAPVLSDDSRNE